MKNRNSFLDLLKFIFALVIVLYHSRIMFGESLANEWFSFHGGYLATEFFFIVSGYLFAASVMKIRYRADPAVHLNLWNDTYSFMKKKVLYLFPNVFIAWLVSFAARNFILVYTSGKTIFERLYYSVFELSFISSTGLRGYYTNTVTWYISSMLLVMLILYPFFRKDPDKAFVGGFIISLFLMGITYRNFSDLGTPTDWVSGLFYKGTIRAFMEILLGCSVYRFSVNIRKYYNNRRLSGFMKTIYTIAEILLYCLSLVICKKYGYSVSDWFCLIILFFAVLITVSGISYTSEIGRGIGKVFSWLGEYSFSLFVGHMYLNRVLIRSAAFNNAEVNTQFAVYMLLSIASGLFIMYISKLLKLLFGRLRLKTE